MAEAHIAHALIIEEWADDRSLAISAPKFTITLFTPQFAKSNTHLQVTLNNFLPPPEKIPLILGLTFDPHFKLCTHIKSIVIRASSRINILKALAGTKIKLPFITFFWWWTSLYCQ